MLLVKILLLVICLVILLAQSLNSFRLSSPRSRMESFLLQNMTTKMTPSYIVSAMWTKLVNNVLYLPLISWSLLQDRVIGVIFSFFQVVGI